MAHQELIQIWKDWESLNDSSILKTESGNYFWAFGVLFSRKVCNMQLCETEINALKRAFLKGEAQFENYALEERRQDYMQFQYSKIA